MKKHADGVNSKLTSLMQLSPPQGLSPKDKPPEIYPQLYFDAAVPEEEEGVSAPVIPEEQDKQALQPKVEIPPANRTLLIERTLRSGQFISYPGHVVVMGDVNPGAEIVAGGHIMVFGSLRGVAHAGAYGNINAVVTAFRLNPTQLRIAGFITRSPDGEEIKPHQPETASIIGDAIVIDKYYPGGERGV